MVGESASPVEADGVVVGLEDLYQNRVERFSGVLDESPAMPLSLMAGICEEAADRVAEKRYESNDLSRLPDDPCSGDREKCTDLGLHRPPVMFGEESLSRDCGIEPNPDHLLRVIVSIRPDHY